MKKVVWFAVTLFALSMAFALEVPTGSQLTVTDENGNVVGTGYVDSSEFELELLSGFEGFAQLAVTDSAGNITNYELMIGSDDGVRLIVGNDITTLEEALSGSGLSVDIKTDDDVSDNDYQDENDTEDNDSDRDDAEDNDEGDHDQDMNDDSDDADEQNHNDSSDDQNDDDNEDDDDSEDNS